MVNKKIYWSNTEFEQYLKKLKFKTAFNEKELETFSWYKKVLGVEEHDSSL